MFSRRHELLTITSSVPSNAVMELPGQINGVDAVLHRRISRLVRVKGLDWWLPQNPGWSVATSGRFRGHAGRLPVLQTAKHVAPKSQAAGCPSGWGIAPARQPSRSRRITALELSAWAVNDPAAGVGRRTVAGHGDVPHWPDEVRPRPGGFTGTGGGIDYLKRPLAQPGTPFRDCPGGFFAKRLQVNSMFR